MRIKQNNQWVIIIFLTIVIDLGVRFATNFEMSLVIRVEAFLFLLTSVVLFILYRQSPPTTRKGNWIQLLIIFSYALAGIRSAIWAAGQPVYLANLTILIIGIIASFIFVVRQQTTGKSN